MPLILVSIKRCGRWAILVAGVAPAESDLSSELSLRYLLSWDHPEWTPPTSLTCALNITHCSLHVSFVLAATHDTRGKATTRPQGVIPVTKAHGIVPWVQTASSVASHTSAPSLISPCSHPTKSLSACQGGTNAAGFYLSRSKRNQIHFEFKVKKTARLWRDFWVPE